MYIVSCMQAKWWTRIQHQILHSIWNLCLNYVKYVNNIFKVLYWLDCDRGVYNINIVFQLHVHQKDMLIL